jgi:CubicO group peptidase (beta-lactamase class C family)
LRSIHIVALVLLGSATARADKIDDLIQAEMAKRKVNGLSLAIIQDGKIVKARGYGVVAAGGAPVTPETLFQAGSVSKSISALGALRLAERGQLALDEDVNARLVGWKVPDSDLTREKKVTVREILSHTAGLTVHGFPGYAVGAAVPTLIQVLDGTPPANTPAIRVEVAPGTEWRYSGGGYTVLQKLMTDVTGKSFPELVQTTVLGPIGMTRSSFQQPLPADRAAQTATGHLSDRSAVEGRWHVYPEMAAAGLWTTASDLARFAIEIQRTLAGKPGHVVSRVTARLMITEVRDGDGLGVFLSGKGRFLQFSHDGRDEGFDAVLIAQAETGQGVAIMINANDNSRMMGRIVQAVAGEYRWPTDKPPRPVAAGVPVDAAVLARYAGRYEIANNNLFTVVARGGKLYTVSDGLLDDELVASGPSTFSIGGGAMTMTFADGATGFSWRRGDRNGTAPRVGPLAEGLAVRADPDPGTTARVVAAMRRIAAHEKDATADASLSPGLVRDLGAGNFPGLAHLGGLVFLDAQDVSGRGIERHDGRVSRVLTYALEPAARPRFLVVYLTADSVVTDFDLVDD